MKIINISIAFLVSMFLLSCSDFLDRDPRDRIAKDKLFQTKQGTIFALNGVYYNLGQYYSGSIIPYAELKGGNVKMSSNAIAAVINQYDNIHNFRHTKDVDQTSDPAVDLYEELYDVLNQANNIVNEVSNVEDADEKTRNQMQGEAFALRALIHFELTRLYAQPYRFSPNGDHLGIATLEKTPDVFEYHGRDPLYVAYNLIIDDLLRAIDLITYTRTGSMTKAWWSVDAAKALLARVYLYKNDWQNAQKYASEVISSASYRLLEGQEYIDSWDSRTPSSEDIMAIDLYFKQDETLSEFFGICSKPNVYFTVTSDLYDLYGENDLRRNLYVTTPLKDMVIQKYQAESMRERPFPLVRLAEMYLIRAEAAAETGSEIQARADLNIIRKRANPDAPNIQLSGLALKEEIFVERRRELALEGHLFFDIVRRGRDVIRIDCNAVENKDLDYPNWRFVLPVPLDEMRYNPLMKQNENY